MLAGAKRAESPEAQKRKRKAPPAKRVVLVAIRKRKKASSGREALRLNDYIRNAACARKERNGERLLTDESDRPHYQRVCRIRGCFFIR